MDLFIYFSFTALSRIFHLYRADRSSKVGENWRTRGKTTWPSVSRTWLSHMWPEQGSNHSGEKPNGLRVLSTRLRGPIFLWRNKKRFGEKKKKITLSWAMIIFTCDFDVVYKNSIQTVIKQSMFISCLSYNPGMTSRNVHALHVVMRVNYIIHHAWTTANHICNTFKAENITEQKLSKDNNALLGWLSQV